MWGNASIISQDETFMEFEKGFRTIRLDEISMVLNDRFFPEEAKANITMINVLYDSCRSVDNPANT